MRNKGDYSHEIMELVESDMHGYVQRELAELKESAPGIDDKKKYFKRNVGAYYRAVNETAATEQRIKQGGFGNNSVKNLTINLSGLGLHDKQKLLDEMMVEIKVLGEKIGYGSKVIETVREVKGISSGVKQGNV